MFILVILLLQVLIAFPAHNIQDNISSNRTLYHVLVETRCRWLAGRSGKGVFITISDNQNSITKNLDPSPHSFESCSNHTFHFSSDIYLNLICKLTIASAQIDHFPAWYIKNIAIKRDKHIWNFMVDRWLRESENTSIITLNHCDSNPTSETSKTSPNVALTLSANSF